MAAPNYGLDPYEAEAGEIERRRRYADVLRAQSMQPIQPARAGNMVARIHPLQGLAQMVQGASAGAAESQAAEERKALAGKYQTDLADTLRRAGEAQRGTPATYEDAAGNYAPQPARAGDPSAAASIYMQHPATRALGIAEVQRQNQAAALRGALAEYGMGGAGQQPAGAGGVGGGAGGTQGGINPTNPGLINIAMMPGGAEVAKLISGREVAAQSQGLNREKFQRAIYEWDNLSANQQAELRNKGIKNALDLAEARDKGIDVSGITLPGVPTNAPPPGAPGAQPRPATPAPAAPGRTPGFPVESPPERATRRTRQIEVLQNELAQEQAMPPSAERDRNIADITKELKNFGASPTAAPAPAAPLAAPTQPGLSPRGAREAAEAGAKKLAEEQAKQKAEMPEVRQRVQIQHQDLDRLANAAREIAGTNLARATGPMGAMPSWPGGQAAQAESLISSLKAQVSGMKLQAMREASKTGGAVGNVTEKEWPRLENMIVALDPVKQGPKLFREKLNELIVEIDKVKASLAQSFQSQYGESHAGTPGNQLTEAERDELARLKKQYGRP